MSKLHLILLVALTPLFAMNLNASNTISNATCSNSFLNTNKTFQGGPLHDLTLIKLELGINKSLEFMIDYSESIFSKDIQSLLEQSASVPADLLHLVRDLNITTPLKDAVKATISSRLTSLMRNADRMRDNELSGLRKAEFSSLYKSILLMKLIELKFKKQTQLLTYSVGGVPRFAVQIGSGKNAVKLFHFVEDDKLETTLAKFEILYDGGDRTRTQIPIRISNKTQSRIVSVQVEGRTPAERRFKLEQKEFEEAAPDDLVKVELIFAASFAPTGHTAIRIGDTAVEFLRRGMVVYEGGTTSARSYLFNNKAMREKYEQLKNQGAAPLSLGITIKMPKKTVVQFLEKARVYDIEANPFEFFKNNCNQCVMKLLEEDGPMPFSHRGAFHRFSSVLTFNRLLQTEESDKHGFYLYPINGKNEASASYREMIPQRIVSTNHTAAEVVELLGSVIPLVFTRAQKP